MVRLVLLALATARLTRLVTEDSITEDLRAAVSQRHELLDELLHCPWCASVWCAGVVLVAPGPLVDILALSEAAQVVRHLAEKDQ